MLLNITVFMWYGVVCPWVAFRVNDVIPIYRLIALGILILLFRRLPMVMLLHKQIREIEHFQQAFFMGFFGPIGVSAVFYLYVSLQFLEEIPGNREDVKRLQDIMRVVIWFLAITSIVVHGLSVPVGKLGYKMPRTISSRFSSEERQGANINSGRSKEYPQQILRRRNVNGRRTEAPVGESFILGQRNGEAQDEPSRPVRIIDDSTPEQSTDCVDIERADRLDQQQVK